MRELATLETTEDLAELEMLEITEDLTELLLKLEMVDDRTELDGNEELESAELLGLLDNTGKLEELGARDDMTLLAMLDGSDSEETLLERTELLAILTTLLLAGLLDATALHTAPVTAGFCAGLLATPLLPCTPNSIL